MDDRWEYDAPQFFDFSQPHALENDFADEWFDKHTEDDELLPKEQLPSAPKIQENRHSDPDNRTRKMQPKRVPVAEKHSSSSNTKATCPSPKKKQKTSGEYKDAATRSALKAENGIKPSEPLRKSPRLQAKCPVKQPPRSPLKRSASLRSLSGVETSASVIKGAASTVAKGKSTEELELEQIAAMKKELARTKKLAENSYKKAMSSTQIIPKRTAQPATMPVGFHFKTDTRLKNTESVSEYKVKDFTKCLREALPSSTLPSKSGNPGLTRPQPFKLSTKSAGVLPQGDKFVSVAESVAAFHRKTPERFRACSRAGSNERSRSANKSSSKDRRIRSQSPQLTVPKTPMLTAKGRSRPIHAISRQEQEMLDYEEHQKQQFKAHPLNRKVLDQPGLGVPEVPKRPLTVQEEFHLHQQKRTMSHGDLRANEEEEKCEFHAKPVNHRILRGPVGIKAVQPQPVTVAQSPAFALKNRVRIHQEETVQQNDAKTSIKACHAPHVGVPFKPRLTHHYTVPEPFTVEQRSKQMLTRREQKIKQVLEEEKKAHEFYAQELPSDSPDPLPPKHVRPVTEVEPFHLEVDERGQKYKQQFKSKIDEEEEASKAAARFKAGPNEVIKKQPFQVEKSFKPLTEMSEFALNTDIRACRREAFDLYLKSKEAEMEALKRQRQIQQEEEEKIAIAKLRNQAVHKATGIRRYNSVRIKPSDKPVTDAQSPCFSTRARAKVKATEV